VYHINILWQIFDVGTNRSRLSFGAATCCPEIQGGLRRETLLGRSNLAFRETGDFNGIGAWWATLESNQAWVSPAELQSAAAPCSPSPLS